MKLFFCIWCLLKIPGLSVEPVDGGVVGPAVANTNAGPAAKKHKPGKSGRK